MALLLQRAHANGTRIAPGGVEANREGSVRRDLTVNASGSEIAAWGWAIAAHRITWPRIGRARRRTRRGSARRTSENGGSGLQSGHGYSFRVAEGTPRRMQRQRRIKISSKNRWECVSSTRPSAQGPL